MGFLPGFIVLQDLLLNFFWHSEIEHHLLNKVSYCLICLRLLGDLTQDGGKHTNQYTHTDVPNEVEDYIDSELYSSDWHYVIAEEVLRRVVEQEPVALCIVSVDYGILWNNIDWGKPDTLLHIQVVCATC